MMNLTEAKMTKLDDESSHGRSVLWIILAGLGIVMMLGAIAGFLSVNTSDGDKSSGFALGFLISLGVIVAGLSYAVWRNARKLKAGGENTTRREKLNRNIIVACVCWVA
jgi:uncharacterized membrane protein YidH (DUF202 family)